MGIEGLLNRIFDLSLSLSFLNLSLIVRQVLGRSPVSKCFFDLWFLSPPSCELICKPGLWLESCIVFIELGSGGTNDIQTSLSTLVSNKRQLSPDYRIINKIIYRCSPCLRLQALIYIIYVESIEKCNNNKLNAYVANSHLLDSLPLLIHSIPFLSFISIWKSCFH